ncbi:MULTISPECIES: MJ0042-type zinc finger domain-containing protein [unclassified Bradyrhizobium]|uniref:MJ0042-type zinc finger domain-containing protein n=1 Tax=unclassified Bradyrhizobium TaxID=2631580 RepID=UPI001FF870D5|nr:MULTISPECIES: MJ0042-type zinc finger domain-containing protein [unclassified Bradyrhizobium]MCK1708904.1 zinc-ribbon domain-containing protein [Bradyrhizobium sp. 143]MCK1726989.1 zinc-ribbon domain-containing protein [Bradyrhizobium sp. 142]
MHIVCPHCTTSYAIKLASLGANGRTVRCSRCKETWMAYPEDAIEEASVPAMAAASRTDDQADLAEQWNSYAKDDGAGETPVVDSPSIASDWPTEDAGETEDDWAAAARAVEEEDSADAQHQSWFRGLFPRRGAQVSRKAATSAPQKSHFGLPTACAAMGALVLALVIWRGDMVRLLPQTAAFYKTVGFDVNLRGLAFKDVKLSSETVDGKQVLVIEGVIVGEGRKALDIPRLRFAVRDAQGAEIYAWNTVLEQTVLRPGERAFFRSRLASPPPEGRNIDVRFFSRRDIAGGSV